MRDGNRTADELRPVSIIRNYTKYAEGSVLVSFGDTKVICTATVQHQVPPFLKGGGAGWVTAEYGMLPRSAPDRIVRDAVKKGRALEISRLIGRSLRCIVDLPALGERQIVIDCDVIQADGGTRTASITGAYVALNDALRSLALDGTLSALPLVGQCAAVSVGIVEGNILLDLAYSEDSQAEVDLNLVMCRDGRIIEIQGCAERKPFSRADMDQMLTLAESGIRRLMAIQDEALRA